MQPVKKYKVELWGEKRFCRPMLLDTVIGDGKEAIWIQYMDDRPNYYIVRVPTGTNALIEDRADEWCDDLLPQITEAIADEAQDFYTERAWSEYERKGYVCTSRRWPIPPSFPAGCGWGKYEIGGARSCKR